MIDSRSGGHEARLWAMVAEHATAQGRQAAVADACAVAVTVTHLSGGGVTMRTQMDSGRVICVTDQISAQIEELQLTFGEGPCMDAYGGRGPVLSSDLRGVDAMHRWPTFAPAASAAGAAAIFAFPLQLGAVRFGVLDLYHTTPRHLDSGELRDALVLAEAAMLLLIGQRAEESDGTDPDATDSLLSEREGYRAEIDQATGMISVQLDIGIGDAFARLRAYAYAHDRKLTDVARDVVNRQLRFEPDPHP
jgi:hypothetical protein